MITVLAAVGNMVHQASQPADIGGAAKNSIAVLPLQNLNGDFSVDYLRFALADEIANTLTYSRTLDVRPSAVTRKYVSADLDPKQVGRELHVGTVLTGHFQKQGDHLLVTLEAIETGTERLIWQTNLTGSTQDLIGMQEQLAKQVRQGLLPMLGAAGGFLETSTRPNNQEAYDLYLRSVALSHDCRSQRETRSRCLEHVVELDPNYAPAWAELGQRYYYDATYSNGGEQMFQHSNAALERALALDPNLIAAASQLIVNRVDRGELGKAYESAQALAKRRPENAQAHFTLGYVQRYAGMLEESTRQCDTALTLAPGNYQFRSCAWAFMELGKFDRARDFIQLDAGSEWANYATPSSIAARRKGGGGPGGCETHVRLLPTTTAISWKPASGSVRRPNWIAWRMMPKPASLQTRIPSFLTIKGRFSPTAARRMPPSTCSRPRVELNYCAYSNLLSDPLLRGLHSDRQV